MLLMNLKLAFAQKISLKLFKSIFEILQNWSQKWIFIFQNISCREIGVSEDSSMPIVQLYYTRMNNGELETRFINKELVDIGAAQWIEHWKKLWKENAQN